MVVCDQSTSLRISGMLFSASPRNSNKYKYIINYYNIMQTKLQCVYPLQLQCFSNDGVTGHDYDWTDWKWLDNTKAPAFRHVFHFLTIALHTAEYIKCKLTQHDTTWQNKTKKNSQDIALIDWWHTDLHDDSKCVHCLVQYIWPPSLPSDTCWTGLALGPSAPGTKV